MVDDSEWLKDWRERSKGALVHFPPKRQYGDHNKMQREEWDSIRANYRAKYGDRQLSEVPIAIERFVPRQTSAPTRFRRRRWR